jgi:DNA modification methylase
MPQVTTRSLLSRISKIDWDFAGNLSESPFSAIHFHPGRFASQVPATLIGLLSKPGETVLDPFSGSGTTLVEAQRLGRLSVGVDLNPVASLMAKAKTLSRTATTISRVIRPLRNCATQQLSEQMNAFTQTALEPALPASVQVAKWYTRRVAHDLGILWHLTTDLGTDTKILAQAAFSSILLDVCRETRHWGYVCDNTTPRGSHGGNVLGEFCRVLDRLERAYQIRDEELSARSADLGAIPESTVITGETAVALSEFPRASFDLVVTSPPYFGVCDYVKAQRLSMEWFSTPLEALRLKEIGARSKRHRERATIEYAADLRAAFAAVHSCMKKGKFLAVIIGESARREGVLSQFEAILKEIGFTLQRDINRNVSTQRRLAPSIMGEHLLLLMK